MKCPSWLNSEGKKYWARNAPALIAHNILNDNNLDKFCMVCEVWGHLRSANPDEDIRGRVWFIGLLKQYQSLSKEFRITDQPRNISEILRDAWDDDE